MFNPTLPLTARSARRLSPTGERPDAERTGEGAAALPPHSIFIIHNS